MCACGCVRVDVCVWVCGVCVVCVVESVCGKGGATNKVLVITIFELKNANIKIKNTPF